LSFSPVFYQSNIAWCSPEELATSMLWE
jgi:hypothetical protein